MKGAHKLMKSIFKHAFVCHAYTLCLRTCHLEVQVRKLKFIRTSSEILSHTVKPIEVCSQGKGIKMCTKSSLQYTDCSSRDMPSREAGKKIKDH